MDVSISGVCIAASLELKAGDIVQLEIADSVFFGFVTFSNPEGDTWRTGIEVQRALIGGADLSRLVQAALLQILPDLPGIQTSRHGAVPATS
jgi:hypothetical protein